MKCQLTQKSNKEINKEGFEGDAAVLIRKEEEGRKPRERLYAEGKAENLETYIKMHKEIVFPNNKMDLSIKERVLQNKGLVWFDPIGKVNIYYIDKDGNVVKVIIDPTKISSLGETLNENWAGKFGPGSSKIGPFKDYSMDGKNIYLSMVKYNELMKQEFKDLGLNEVSFTEIMPTLIDGEMEFYNEKIENRPVAKQQQMLKCICKDSNKIS